MIDGKEYANQMRENAVIDKNGNIIVSEELWQQIANIIETQQAEIDRLKTEKDNLIKTYAECQIDFLKELQRSWNQIQVTKIFMCKTNCC